MIFHQIIINLDNSEPYSFTVNKDNSVDLHVFFDLNTISTTQ